MSKILEINNVSAGYADEIILRDINLVVNDNDYIGIIGPNGGGKTTLLKVMLGLIKPFRGNVILYNGRENHSGNMIGYLPQINQIDLLSHIGAGCGPFRD
jgi:zinc transport system ATP-binding protein